MAAPIGWYPDPNPAPGIAVAAEQPEPKDDPFYQCDPAQLPGIPGTVLKTRRIRYHIGDVHIPGLRTTQLLYRSNSATGKPTVNVTSVIRPCTQCNKTKVLSYQSAYDSLNPSDEPSFAISGGHRLGGLVSNVELLVFFPFLAEGYTVIVPDIEGQGANFAAGPEYGMNTLDSIRAALSKDSKVGLPDDAKVALLGYSGGGIATEWAAELAPTYAPDLNRRLIGAAMGGLLVHPAHNLHYIKGTPFWGGVMLMALVGITRAFDKEQDFKKYLNANGVQLFDAMKTKSIVNVLGQYWDPVKCGLKWEDLAKPEYPTPESIPPYVECVNKLIMGTGGDPHGATKPTIPLFIGQGYKGQREGTPNHGKYGPGDGVMIARDVHTLARNYCAKNVPVWYQGYCGDSHITSLLIWLPNAIAWIKQRFESQPAPQNWLPNTIAGIIQSFEGVPAPQNRPLNTIARIKQRFEGQPAPQNWLPTAIAGIKQGFEGLPAPQNCSLIPEGNPLEPLPVPQEP